MSGPARGFIWSGGLAVLLAACAAGVTSPSRLSDPAAFMRAYTEAWNRHDSATIARDFYDMGRTVEEQTRLLEAQFEGLRAQGYVRSDIHEVRACLTGTDTGWGGLKFTRLKADGEPLPPKDRASQYDLRRLANGSWRITRLYAGDPAAPLACPAN